MKAKFVERRDIIITIPKSVNWDVYKREIDSVADGSKVMNFKVTSLPINSGIGKRCYLCYNGFIVGWMKIVGFMEKEFVCDTTGKPWSGKFIQRSGPFHELDSKIPMKGFRGYRYV